MEKIRILIFARQKSVRQKLWLLLKMEPDFEVVAEASSDEEITELVNSKPMDILVFSLASIDDLYVLQSEHQRHLNIKSIVVYYNEDASYVNEMLRSGARAYISSECAPAELASAVREVMSGKVHLSSPLFEHAIEKYIGKKPSSPNSPSEILTKREFEVFNLVVKGLTSAQIGTYLSISRRTVEIHRANMLRKLNLASQYKQIKNYAIELGIIMNHENQNAT